MPKGKKKAAKVTNGATGNSSVEASTGQVRPNAPYLENRGALILSIGPEAATGLNFSAEELPEGLTQIPGLHITLIGAMQLKKVRQMHPDLDLPPRKFPVPKGLVVPPLKFGACSVARRNKKATLFAPVKNQFAMHQFVQQLCEHIGITRNPEPKRFFHVSLANNGHGSPFHSIGDISMSDVKS